MNFALVFTTNVVRKAYRFLFPSRKFCNGNLNDREAICVRSKVLETGASRVLEALHQEEDSVFDTKFSPLDELNVRVSGLLVRDVLMARDGLSPDLYTFNILLHILGRGNKPLAALTTLNHMKEVGIEPSVIHFTTLIDGYVISGELEKAKEMFSEMTSKGQLPNVFTYNAMIRGLCMAGEFREACWMLKEMESRGCSPNFVVYSTLVSYLRKAGKLGEARKVIRDMVKKGHYVHLVPKMMKYRR
ncbi:hypothetical protein HID58_060615 [Brassica napus]|uniref:Pentatricopeptide repeat-containing protein n=1 Tax=Brassica napus TaxID=3708 RepID=A0ABQ7ZW73_BRANA|nr:hypothetical protein HID58_060615 [Brassica napus]